MSHPAPEEEEDLACQSELGWPSIRMDRRGTAGPPPHCAQRLVSQADIQGLRCPRRHPLMIRGMASRMSSACPSNDSGDSGEGGAGQRRAWRQEGQAHCTEHGIQMVLLRCERYSIKFAF